MPCQGDSRAVAPVVGAILLFAIFIIALSSYQAIAVPNQNFGVEFDHHSEVSSDLQDVRSAIVTAAGTDATQTARVSLGPTYPNRVVGINPGPPDGELSTAIEEPLSVTIENATAIDEDVAAFWDGSPIEFETQPIVYTPGYHEYDGAPETVIEHGILFDVFDTGATIPKNNPSFISSRSVSFVFPTGNFRETGTESVAIDADPVSATRNTVAVEGIGDPITIELETLMDEETWNSILADIDGVTLEEFTDDDPNRVRFSLDAETTYRLRLGSVAVGDGSFDTAATYLTRSGGDGTTIPVGTEVQFEVAVRDRFNNPVEGTTVSASLADGDGILEPTTSISDGDGMARIAFTPSSPDTHEIAVQFEDGDGEPYESVTFTVEAFEPGEGEDPVEPPRVTLDSNAIDDQVHVGEDLELIGEVSSLGETGTIRSGTPILWINYTAEDSAGNIQDEGTVYSQDHDGTERVVSVDETISTQGWEPDEYEITLEGTDATSRTGSDAVTVEVTEPDEPVGPYFEVAIDEINDEVTVGAEVTVEYTIENIGEEADTQDIEFVVDDAVVDTEPDVELDPEETFSGSFSYTTENDDQPEITVAVVSDDDSDSATVTVSDMPPPYFTALSAESDGPSGQDRIRDIEFEGTVENVDPEGTILFELIDEGTVYWSEEISMTESFEFDESQLEIQRDVPIDVRITLRDADGEDYSVCLGEFTDNEQTLTLEDGLECT